MQLEQKWKYLQRLVFPEDPPLLAHSSPISQNLLLFVRVYAGLYMTGIYCYDILLTQSPLDKFLYFTNTAYYMAWLHFITILQSKLGICKQLEKYSEVFFQVAFCMEWIITVAFWTFLRLSIKLTMDFFMSLNAHGVVLFLLTLDFILNSYRFIYSQFIMFILICGAYLIFFNLPYSLTISPVYGVAINWKTWYSYFFIFLAGAGGLLAFFVSRQIYVRLKQPRLKSKYPYYYRIYQKQDRNVKLQY